MKLICQFVICMVLQSALIGQTSHKLLRQGDHAYKQEQFDLAEESYRKSLEKKPSTKGTFNLGNTVYQQDRFEEAIQHYEQATNGMTTDLERAEALYNLGNAQLQNGLLEESIDSYKQAVQLNPEDDDVRQNLYLAKLMRKQQQEQQQQQQQEQQNQQEQEAGSDEQQQQQEQGESEQQQEQASTADIDNEGGSSSEPQDAQELSKEDAEKLLKVIENEEKNVQEKLRKISGNKKKPKKDW